MDPLSQGLVGGIVPQSVIRNRSQIRAGSILGFLSAMTPDLDVFIRSANDPLLALEYHRQFTHSIFFIPLGGLLCALLGFYFVRKKFTFLSTYIFCTLGYATHGLLDSCTTYGTQWFWPFSNMRVAWNTVSIIDPLYTFPLLILFVWAFLKKNQRIGIIAVVYAFLYMGLGLLGQHRAETVITKLAQQRGHQAINIDASPSFGNILLWRVLYEYDGKYYVDAVRTGFSSKVYEGESILKLDLGRDLPQLKPESILAKDIERFRWFTNNYLAVHPQDPNMIIDVRYSFIPNETQSLWGIYFSLNDQDQHVHFGRAQTNSFSKKRSLFFKMLFNNM